MKVFHYWRALHKGCGYTTVDLFPEAPLGELGLGLLWLLVTFTFAVKQP